VITAMVKMAKLVVFSESAPQRPFFTMTKSEKARFTHHIQYNTH